MMVINILFLGSVLSSSQHDTLGANIRATVYTHGQMNASTDMAIRKATRYREWCVGRTREMCVCANMKTHANPKYAMAMKKWALDSSRLVI